MVHVVRREPKMIELLNLELCLFFITIYLLAADEDPGPVKWTRPYFDCGRSNRWIVAAVTPIADIYPRHTGFRHIEYPTYVVTI